MGSGVELATVFLFLVTRYPQAEGYPFHGSDCFIDNVVCVNDDGSMLDIFNKTTSLPECKDLCVANNECQFYSYTEGNLKCTLHSTCNTYLSTGSVTGQSGVCTCSLDRVLPVHGKLIQTEQADSEARCRQVTGCKLYTFDDGPWDEEDKMCYLLESASSFQGPAFTGIGISTGPADCTSIGGICKFALLELSSNGVLIDYTRYLDLKVAMRDCMVNLSVVAIGDGGDIGSGGDGGGGSGYVESGHILMAPNQNIKIYISLYENTTVTVDNEVVIEARNGEDANGYWGGAGYSGGGGSFDGDGWLSFGDAGGTDGRNGKGRLGGRGSGLDVRRFSTSLFQLSPGISGPGGEWKGGGGGGGVLVNGKGPSAYGYGSGRGGNGGGRTNGCVLLAFVK